MFLVLGPQWIQQITEGAFQISPQSDWQINNSFLNRPTM